jgi:hypothetical protein
MWLGVPGINLCKILDSLKDVPGFLGENEIGWSFEKTSWSGKRRRISKFGPLQTRPPNGAALINGA